MFTQLDSLDFRGRSWSIRPDAFLPITQATIHLEANPNPAPAGGHPDQYPAHSLHRQAGDQISHHTASAERINHPNSPEV